MTALSLHLEPKENRLIKNRFGSRPPFSALAFALILLSVSPLAFLALAQIAPSKPASLVETGMPGTAQRAAVTYLGSKSPNTLNNPASLHQPDRPASLSSLSLGTPNSFGGMDQLSSSCGCYPPDVIIATGPTQVVEMVNLEIQVFNKQGWLLQDENLSMFYNFGPSYSAFSDPKIVYDASSGRFFTSIIDVGHYNLVTSVSSNSSALGSWTVYNLPQQRQGGGNSLFPDQPILGINDDKVIISTNDFVGNILAGAQYWVLNKSQMVSGASSVNYQLFGPFANQESVHPVQSLSSTKTEYMVSTGAIELGTTGSVVELYSVNGIPPNASVATTNITLLSPISPPPPALERGTNGNPGNVWFLGENDARVLDAKWFQGTLWYSLTEGCTPSGDSLRSCVRLTELNTATNGLVQDIDYSATGMYYFYPAVAIDSLGSLTVVYGFSSNTTYPSLAVTGQRYDDPAYTLRQPRTLANGTLPNNSGRYGDYFGASVDPSDTTLTWVAGEYYGFNCGAFGNCWLTNIASVSEYFSINASNTLLYAHVAHATTNTITLALTSFGFSGTVTLSTIVSPSGHHISTGLNPASVTLTSTGTGQSTLTVSTTSTTGFGVYTITVTGSSGSISSTVTLTLCVFITFKGQIIC